MASGKQQTAAGEPGFDERLERLEAIVAELEGGGLGLETALERYQEGIEHLKQCHGRLETYKQRVEELTLDAGEVLRPFSGDPDAELVEE
jgi:exodeoxyribonuclease VII small subunit